jgi:HSP20 family molecular chaperone IbpA
MTYRVSHPALRRRAAHAGFPSFYVAPVAAGRQTPRVPVNITETDHAYELALVAPGLKKEFFRLAVAQDILTVKLELPTDASAGTYTHREFALENFERRFRLPEQVEADQISATYQDGLLTLTLPKRADHQSVRSITVQ